MMELMGPLQQMGLHGSMIWQMSASDKGSKIIFQYTVSGFLAEGDFEGLAPAVDGVIGSQLQGLIAFLEPEQDQPEDG